MKELFTAIIAFVKAAELAYPEGGKGKEKLDAVSAAVTAYAPLVGVAADALTTLAPMIQAFAATVVAWFNATGFFKKAAPTPTA